MRPQTIGKVARPGGGLEWSNTVMQLVLDLLAHCTLPSYISYNILIVSKVILPNSDGIHNLPGVVFICLFQVTLSYITKILASDELSRFLKFREQHVDGTAR